VRSSGEYSKRITDSTRAYERAHGDPVGQPCFHCGEPIPHRWRDSLSDPERYPYRLAFTVHHKDYDQTNNDPANLAPSHQHCNSGDRSPEGEARILAGQRASLAAGRKVSDETRAKMRAGWTPERRAISAANMRRNRCAGDGDAARARAIATRYRCGGCSRVTNAAGMKMHQQWTGHEGRVRVA
jgi:hypothetical protein